MPVALGRDNLPPIAQAKQPPISNMESSNMTQDLNQQNESKKTAAGWSVVGQ